MGNDMGQSAEVNASKGKKRVVNGLVVTVWALRLLVGAVFIMSGFVKMIDPWGFLFKLEEYLGIWGMTQPRTIVLMAVLLISGYEFVLGSLLALGCYKRTAPWGLALMMVVMLPLTLYIWVTDPVSDCGCFGDFWKISNAATFWKNVAISAAIVVLIKLNPRVRQSLFSPSIQWMVGAWLSLYILLIGLYGYNIAPMLDFRAFPEGASLVGVDGGADEEYMFTYEKDGETKQFAIDNLPDSTWTFVDRVEPEGHSSAASLAIYDGDEDVTSDVISSEGKEIVMVIPEPLRADISYTFMVNEMYEYADSLGVPMIGLLGGGEKSVARWVDIAMAEYPCYSADDTQLKELSRGLMSVVLLEDGKVLSKATVSSLNPSVMESPSGEGAFMTELTPNHKKVLGWLNLVFGGGLLLLYLFQGIILALRYRIRKYVAARRAKSTSSYTN